MSRIAVILTLPIEYNTSSMLRTDEIIRALVSLGHTVTCYTPVPDKHNKYYDAELKIENISLFRYGKTKNRNYRYDEAKIQNGSIKTRMLRVAYKIFKKVDVFGATLVYLPERRTISKSIKKGHFDVLMSFSDPMTAHMIGKYCKKHNKNLRYIQQWGDPLASDTICKTAMPVWLRKIVEESLLKPADRVCYVSPFTALEQKSIFPKQSNKMIFTPTPSLSNDSYGIKDCERGKRLCLGYFGSYNSVARNIMPFYNVAKKMQDVDFFIIGDSDLELKSTLNVQVLPRVSQEELNDYMARIDVIVCLMNIKGNQIPGKVYHDASSKKDILLIKDGEYGEEIECFFSKYNHYTFVNNSEKDITKAIELYLKSGVPERSPVSDFSALKITENILSKNYK